MTDTRRARYGEAQEFLLAAVDAYEDDCIEWPFHRKNGYGIIGWCGESRNAHAVVCELAYGAAPTPKHDAAHAPEICHNRACINWRHLRWATRTENARDTMLDGTTTRGERCGMAKLTEVQVTEIRRRYVRASRWHRGPPGSSQAELAAEFGVTAQTIGKIVGGVRWGWMS